LIVVLVNLSWMTLVLFMTDYAALGFGLGVVTVLGWVGVVKWMQDNPERPRPY
jgi:hypothetical protein